MIDVMFFMLKVLYSLCESGWRRWFGGGYIGGKEKENKWYNIRAFQHLVGGLITFLSILFLQGFTKLEFMNWLIPNSCVEYSSYIISLYVTIVFQGLFWARGHGPAFDMSRGGQPDEKLKERYKKEWWNKICEFIVPKSEWYGYGYDKLWMTIRYTACTLLLTPIYGWGILFMGLMVPVIYSICWSIYDRKPELFNKFPTKMQIHGATSLAEWIVGFTSGLFLMFL